MKNPISFVLLPVALGLATTTAVLAGDKHHAHGHETPAAQPAIGTGTINKLDPATGKANITHGPIKSLGWSGMTMDFVVQDKAGLAALRPGQKVEFELGKDASGQHVISRIRAVQ